MINPIGWFEIYVNDLNRARAFYESVFNCTLTKMNSAAEGMALLGFASDMKSYGASGALVQMEGFPAGNNSTIVYFACDDCAVEQARVAGAGGTVCQEKFSIGEFGFIALVNDTEGNMIGLHSMV